MKYIQFHPSRQNVTFLQIILSPKMLSWEHLQLHHMQMWCYISNWTTIGIKMVALEARRIEYHFEIPIKRDVFLLHGFHSVNKFRQDFGHQRGRWDGQVKIAGLVETGFSSVVIISVLEKGSCIQPFWWERTHDFVFVLTSYSLLARTHTHLFYIKHTV